MKVLWEKFRGLKFWQKALIVFFALGLIGQLGEPPQKQPAKTESQVTQTQPAKQSTTVKVDLKNQQSAFTAWEDKFMSKTKDYDEIWKTWDLTAQGISNGQLNMGQAYNLLSKLEDALGSIQSDFYTMDIPGELSEQHKKLLKEAVESMGTATYCRRDGVKHFLKYMDDSKPSSYSKALDQVKSSNDYIMNAAFKVGQVKEELGLIKKQQ